MKLIATKHDYFPDIDAYNPRFRIGSLRLKLTIDTLSPRKFYLNRFPALLFDVLDLFPRIKHHRCAHGKSESRFRDYNTGHWMAPIRIIGDVIDTVHLLEHVILELNCQIGGMEICSGLTCNYWEPENRYDVFIECDDFALGIFSTNFGLKLFHQLLYGQKFAHDVRELMLLAGILYEQPEIPSLQLQQRLGWAPEQIASGLAQLKALQFPDDSARRAA